MKIKYRYPWPISSLEPTHTLVPPCQSFSLWWFLFCLSSIFTILLVLKLLNKTMRQRGYLFSPILWHFWIPALLIQHISDTDIVICNLSHPQSSCRWWLCVGPLVEETTLREARRIRGDLSNMQMCQRVANSHGCVSLGFPCWSFTSGPTRSPKGKADQELAPRVSWGRHFHGEVGSERADDFRLEPQGQSKPPGPRRGSQHRSTTAWITIWQLRLQACVQHHGVLQAQSKCPGATEKNPGPRRGSWECGTESAGLSNSKRSQGL